MLTPAKSHSSNGLVSRRPNPLYCLTVGLQHTFSLFDPDRKQLDGVLLNHRYRARERLGEGSFAATVRADDTYYVQPGLDEGETPACRQVAIKMMKSRYEKIGHEEVKNLAKLHSGSFGHGISALLPTCFDSFTHAGRFCLVMELLRKPDWHALNHREIKTAEQRLRWLRKLAFDLTLQLCHVHRHELVHADVKLENVMQRAEEVDRFMLIDYGNAFERDQFHHYYGDFQVQSLLYRAPEVLFKRQPLSQAIDFWSLGVLLMEAASLDHRNPFFSDNDVVSQDSVIERMSELLGPFSPSYADSSASPVAEGEEAEALLDLCRRDNISKFTRIRDADFVDFVGSLLAYEPEKRLQSTQALKHPFLAPMSPILSFFA